jgi:hypothetical protein
LNVSKAVVIDAPLLFRHSKSDGADYIESMSRAYIQNMNAFFAKRNIEVIYVVSPPHFSFYSALSATSKVVLLPYLIDSHQSSDSENIILRASRECFRRSASTVEYFSDESLTNLDLDAAAGFILASFGPGLFRMEGNDSLSVRDLQVPNCSLSFVRSPHIFRSVATKAGSVVIPNGRPAGKLVAEAFERTTHFNSIYLSIVVTGGHIGTDEGFLARVQTFFNHIGEGLLRIPLADIELVFVDYATAHGQPHPHEVLAIPRGLKGRTKFVIVPPPTRKRYGSKGVSRPISDLLARNIGIRRSRGEFVVALTPDIFLPDNFFELCAQRAFNAGVLYTATRRNIEGGQAELATINEPWRNAPGEQFFSFEYLAQNLTVVDHLAWVHSPNDFTLLSAQLWDALGAYDLFGFKDLVSALFPVKMFKLVSSGFAANLPNPYLHCHHTGDDEDGPSGAHAFFASASFWDYVKYGKLKNVAAKADPGFWGFPNQHFQEIIV